MAGGPPSGNGPQGPPGGPGVPMPPGGPPSHGVHPAQGMSAATPGHLPPHHPMMPGQGPPPHAPSPGYGHPPGGGGAPPGPAGAQPGTGPPSAGNPSHPPSAQTPPHGQGPPPSTSSTNGPLPVSSPMQGSLPASGPDNLNALQRAIDSMEEKGLQEDPRYSQLLALRARSNPQEPGKGLLSNNQLCQLK